MIHSCVTVSLVPEARGGPFIFWDDLGAACRKARELGFDAVEIFPPSADALEEGEVRDLLDRYHLKLAAVGTGAGWILQKLRLTDPDRGMRTEAIRFVHEIVEAAGRLGAPAIIGSMQGRCGDGLLPREEAMFYLGNALAELGEHARRFGVPLLYEPLNRYETNLVNSVEQGLELLSHLPIDAAPDGKPNVRLLLDLFHMNIEERDLPAAIRSAGAAIGHVHLADSNRQPAGCGHTDFPPIAQALRDIGYGGYVSAEALPHPDPDTAADLTIQAFFRNFGGAGRALDV